MRAVIQRVTRASVGIVEDGVDARVSGAIDREGLMVLLGVTHDDGDEQVETVARKICELRILEGEKSVLDTGAPVLIVSQFTLYADVKKGRRPSWNKAAPGHIAEPIVQRVIDAVKARGVEVAEGEFGAHMRVDLVNDGPMTILIDC